MALPNDPGFIHAPSLNQASASALRRNAHLAHGGERDSPFAIELTSARVRLAKQLFDGIRQGQPLGALLGYAFERSLHEAGLDELIDEFRAVAPLPGASTPTSVRRLVVDGLRLSGKWQADPNGVLAAVSVGAAEQRRERVEQALDSLERQWTQPLTRSTPRARSRWSAATTPGPQARWTRFPPGRCRLPTWASCGRRARESASPTGRR